MNNCIICKLIFNEIPAFKVYEDKNFFAFLDINPSAPGHTLVVPKKHVPTLFDLDKNELGEIFLTVQKIASSISDSDLKPEGFNIGVNSGRSSGQEINHLHIHIIPRWRDDKGGAIQSIVSHSSSLTLEEILAKIKL